MNESKIKVVLPDFIKEAVERGIRIRGDYNISNHETNQPHLRESLQSVEDAFVALAENPIVPTDEQLREIITIPQDREWQVKFVIGMFQRRMFLAPPEPEVPQELSKLFWEPGFTRNAELHNVQIVGAFRRGQRSK
jgi:hypothetical protein